MSETRKLGIVTAYGYAKSKGYTGTEEEFAQLMADYAEVGEDARSAANAAQNSAAAAATAEINAAASEGQAQAIADGLDTRLDSQDAAIAAIRAAVGSPLVANTAAAMTDQNKIYVYTGDESGFTAGNWYYYDGTAWASGGVYNSSAVETDTTLSVSGVPADAKAAGYEIESVKSAFDDVTENLGSENIFNPSYLVSIAGWNVNGNEYSGTALQLKNAFFTSPYYPVSCDSSKRYTFSFKAKTDNSGGYSGIGLAFSFIYADGSSNPINVPNATRDYTEFVLVSSDITASHGGIIGIQIVYSSGGSNIWYLKDLRLNEGTSVSTDQFTAIDTVARSEIDNLKGKNISNIRLPCINFQFDDGASKDADIVDIFDNYSFKCGFALPTNIASSAFPDYLTYQENGYEILSHSTDGTGMNDATIDPATIEGKLQSSKSALEALGFTIKGFVTPNSTMAEVFKPILRKYYEWAETIYFGAYTGTGQPYMKPFNGVYNGWRVSLQSTTLANQKAAVDACIENYGCLTFYGHAAALDTTDYLTTENLEALLTYIAGKVSNGEVIVGTPSEVILNYFSVRNDDVSGGWVNVTSAEASLDARFSINKWDMQYNEKLGLMWFAVRVAPTEAISGQIQLFTFPKSVTENQMVLNESGRVAFSYGGQLLITDSGTWAQGTNYRFSGMLKLK